MITLPMTLTPLQTNLIFGIFCTIGSNLADTINSETTKKPTDYLKKQILDTIYLDPPSTNKVLNQITSLKNKAVGHDNIQPFFL